MFDGSTKYERSKTLVCPDLSGAQEILSKLFEDLHFIHKFIYKYGKIMCPVLFDGSQSPPKQSFIFMRQPFKKIAINLP